MIVDMGADGAFGLVAYNLDECLAACVDGASICYAMEYSQDLGCWKHTSSFDTSTLMSLLGVTIYKPVNCTAAGE
jgi:hypothetical protein